MSFSISEVYFFVSIEKMNGVANKITSLNIRLNLHRNDSPRKAQRELVAERIATSKVNWEFMVKIENLQIRLKSPPNINNLEVICKKDWARIQRKVIKHYQMAMANFKNGIVMKYYFKITDLYENIFPLPSLDFFLNCLFDTFIS